MRINWLHNLSSSNTEISRLESLKFKLTQSKSRDLLLFGNCHRFRMSNRYEVRNSSTFGDLDFEKYVRIIDTSSSENVIPSNWLHFYLRFMVFSFSLGLNGMVTSPEMAVRRRKHCNFSCPKCQLNPNGPGFKKAVLNTCDTSFTAFAEIH